MKKIPLHCLVLMVGPSGAGKSAIAAKHFESYEIIDTDQTRYNLIGDHRRSDRDYLVTNELNRRVRTKLEIGERVVVDAMNLKRVERQEIVEIGNTLGVPIFYIVVERPLAERLVSNSWRTVSPELMEEHDRLFTDNERSILGGDGIATVIDTRREEFEVVRKPPLTAISNYVLSLGYKGVMALGDVHGVRESLKGAIDWSINRNLFMIFLGDIIDYGPYSLDCVDIVYDLVTRGRGMIVMGNHEKKIEKWISQDRRGDVKLKLSDGNKATTRQIQDLTPRDRTKFECKFAGLLNQARNHILLDDTLMFTHGGGEPEMFKMATHRLSGHFESMAVFGETDRVNRINADGYPNRVYNWVNRIPDGKRVIVGHDIRSDVKPLTEIGNLGGEAIFMDTGSGKGGHLTTAHIIYENGYWAVKNFTSH